MEITEKSLLEKLAALGEITKEQRNRIACDLIGHSRIVTICFGYVYCARCGEQIADKLGGYGYSDAPNAVVVGHNCPTCRANYDKMDWHDKLFVPDPFDQNESAEDEEPLFDGDERRCRICGCTEDNACTGGCWWVEEDLCSVCAQELQDDMDIGEDAEDGMDP